MRFPLDFDEVKTARFTTSLARQESSWADEAAAVRVSEFCEGAPLA